MLASGVVGLCSSAGPEKPRGTEAQAHSSQPAQTRLADFTIINAALSLAKPSRLQVKYNLFIVALHLVARLTASLKSVWLGGR